MNINYDKLSEVTGRITIKVEEADYAPEVKKALKEAAKRPEKGFRPGHVPQQILEKKYGKAAKYEALNKVVSDALYNYVKEQSFDVLGQPIPEQHQEINLDEKDFTYQFLIGLAPAIDVAATVNKNMHIPYYHIEITDEMIDRQDEQLRRRFGQQVPGDEVDADALVKGVITELGADGQPLENGIVQEAGIVAPKYFSDEEQRNLFLGKKVGDEVLFNPWKTCNGNPTELSSMLGLPKEEAELCKNDFLFSIREIIVLKPAELGQEYYDQVFGKDHVKDEKQYREAVKNMIEGSLVPDQNYRFSIDAENAVLKAIGNVDLPDEVIKDFLKMQQDTKENADKVDAEYDKMRPGILWEIAQNAIAKELKVEVAAEDVRNVARMMARQQLAQYGMTNLPDESIDRFADNFLTDKERHNQIASNARANKIFAAIREAVTIDDKNVSVDEFNALFSAPEAQA